MRRLANIAVRKYLSTAAPESFVRRQNQILRLRRQGDINLSYDPERKLFMLREGGDAIYVARQQRIWTQLRGIQKRQNDVLRQYLGPYDIIRPGDVVIDCGANIGEFAIKSAALGATVHAFEPDPQEFKALVLNAANRATVNRVALWHEAGELTFFDKNATGDSSLIDPGNATASLIVESMTLDNYCANHGLKRIRLFKLEAEGAEPEILLGASAMLCTIDYIAVDMGPERGITQDSTLAQVTDALYSAGFKIIHFNAVRHTGLFERRNVI